MASLALAFDILAKDKASREFDRIGDAADRAGKKGSGFGTVMKRAVGVAAAAFAAAGIRDFVAEGAQALGRIETLAAQTDAVIKSTGGAAGVTRASLDELAAGIERLTSVEAEAVTEGANMLLTFTGIRNQAGAGNDVFDQAVQAMTDFSVATGTDAKGAAVQLGKALNNPVKGVTALQRAGVSFTAAQKDQIAALVESGDVMGAQKLILSELTTQFGGSAEALGSTFPGRIQKLKNAFGEVQESIVAQLLPAAESLVSWAVSDGLPMFRRFGDVLSSDVVPRVRDLVGVFQAEVLPRLQEFAGFVGDEVVPRIRALAEWVGRNKEFFVPFVAALATGAAVFKTIVAVTQLWAAAQAALNVVLAMNPIGLVVVAIAALVAGLVFAWKNSETFRAVVTTAFEWVSKAFGWVWDAAQAVLGWLKANWPTILAVVTGPIGLAVRVVLKYWDTLVAGTRAVFNAVRDWIRARVGEVVAVADRVAAFRDRVVAAFRALKDQAIARVGELVSWVAGLPGRLLSAVGDLHNRFVSVGRDIIAGMVQGVRNGVGAIRDAVKDAASSALDAAKSLLGISSPSKVFRDQVGAMVPAGMVEGILGGRASVASAVDSLVHVPAVAVAASIGAAGAASAGAAAGPMRIEGTLDLGGGLVGVVRGVVHGELAGVAAGASTGTWD